MNIDDVERFTILAGMAITWVIFAKVGESFPKMKQYFNPRVAPSKKEKINYITVAVPVFCMLLSGFLLIAIISYLLESLPIPRIVLVVLCCIIVLSWGTWLVLKLRKRE